jgi:hypothetical protein
LFVAAFGFLAFQLKKPVEKQEQTGPNIDRNAVLDATRCTVFTGIFYILAFLIIF